jgi:hypothetical protein
MDDRTLRIASAARRWLPALAVVLIPLVETAKRW